MNLTSEFHNSSQPDEFSKPTLLQKLADLRQRIFTLPILSPIIRGKLGSNSLNLLLALTLTLPAIVLSASTTLNTASQNLEDSRHISVFISNALDATKIEELATTLKARQEFSSATVLDDQLVSNLLTHPTPAIDLPHLLELGLAKQVTSNELTLIISEISTLPGIEFVDANTTQLDEHTEAARMSGILSLATGLLALTLTIIMVAHLTRRDIRSQQRYLAVMNQQGASLSTIRMPFYYRSITFVAIGAFFGTFTCWLGLIYAPTIVDLSTIVNVLPDSFSVVQLAAFLLISLSTSLLAVTWKKTYIHTNQ